jgi:hypothetical protein
MTTRKKLPRIKRISPTGSGSYSFDNGAVAFSDITERLEKNTTKREYKRSYNKDYQREKKAGKSQADSKLAFHRKHG